MSEFEKYIKKAKSKNYSEMNFQGDNPSTMKQNLRSANNDDDLDLKEKRKQVKLKAAEYIDALNKGDDDVDILQSVIEVFANNINSMSLNDVETALIQAMDKVPEEGDDGNDFNDENESDEEYSDEGFDEE